jgi:hypothetical protein
MINRFFLLVLTTILTVSATDQVVGPAGTYTVTTSGPTKVTSGEGWVKIEWEAEPSTPTPPPPTPTKPVESPPVVTPPPVVVPPVVGPTPAMPATPLTGQVWMLAVYDQTKAGAYPPAQQAILLPPSKGGSATLAEALAELKIVLEKHDINDQVMKGSNAVPDPQNPDKITTWKGEALKQGLPCLIVINNPGGKLQWWPFPLPADEAAMIELGRKMVGQ